MSYSEKLNGKGKFKLFFKEDGIILESGKDKINIGFDEIKKNTLTPVRRTRHYHFSPSCIIKTKNDKLKITSRGYVHRAVSSVFVSKNEDVNLMSNISHELHRILVEKGLHNEIKFVLGGYLHFSSQNAPCESTGMTSLRRRLRPSKMV